MSLSEASTTVEAKSSEDPLLSFEILFAVAGSAGRGGNPARV